jgi:asparagine synthase (glutamine-hydrolysing)
VLSGAGGDEIFAGYPWRYYRAVVNDDFDHYAQKYYGYWQRLVPDEDFGALISPMGPAVASISPREIFRQVFSSNLSAPKTAEDYVNYSLYFEAKTFLHGLLVVEDKLSMAHGLEMRVPFLDNDLVDFAMRVPVNLKLGNLGEVARLNENEPGPKTQRYFERTHDGKLLLRKMMKRYVPSLITEGTKRGFSGPDATWFRGESIEYVRKVLLAANARIYQFLDRKVVHRLIDDHLAGRVNRRLLIWSLLSIEAWCEAFVS